MPERPPSRQPLWTPSGRGDPWRSARSDRQRLGGPGVIILDTHVLLWLDREDPAFGPSSRERIRTAWGQGSVAVYAMSFWEVAMLAARSRVELRQSPESWRVDWLRAGLEEIALDGAAAVSRHGEVNAIVVGEARHIGNDACWPRSFHILFTPSIIPPPAEAPRSTAPGLHLIGVGCGGCRRGGIGTEQQGIEPGFDSGEPFVLFLQLFDIVLDQLLSLLALLLPLLEHVLSPLALEHSDPRIDGWMPI